MIILTLDTSGPCCSVALMRDGLILCELFGALGLTHSETLMPMVDEALKRAGVKTEELGLVACVAGPGSFTGVRIGVCAAKGLAHAHGIPCAQLDALEVLAMDNYGFDGVICPILDARRDQVYAAQFCFAGGVLPERLTEDEALPLIAFVQKLPPDRRVLFVGDGVSVHARKIREYVGTRALLAPPHRVQLRASAGCVLANRDPSTHCTHLELAPIYLRAPQAERERAERMAKEHG